LGWWRWHFGGSGGSDKPCKKAGFVYLKYLDKIKKCDDDKEQDDHDNHGDDDGGGGGYECDFNKF